MIRATLVAGALLAVLGAAPAQGAFGSCTFSGGTVTATSGSGTTGTLKVAAGAIQADGVNCQTATVNNTDTIVVDADAGAKETFTIDLTGGPFAPGATTGSEGTSPEIEFDVRVQEPVPGLSDEITILGTTAADHVTIGQLGGPIVWRVNLNADEAANVDHDMELDGFAFVRVIGGQGEDVLDGNGGDGTGPAGSDADILVGGPDDDELTVTRLAVPGPGDDTVRFGDGTADSGAGEVSYFDAGPVVVTLEDGTGGDWGGATNDGQGGADTYLGHAGFVRGSNDPAVGDVYTGSIYDDTFFGSDGPDGVNGGDGSDLLFGQDGDDILHGGDGDDTVEFFAQVDGGDGDDQVFGDAGNDTVDGGDGDDQVSGGAADDTLRESGDQQSASLYQNPSGADDLSGGTGIDSLEYGDPGFTHLPARTLGVSVDLDDVADDGAPGEGDNARSDIENIVGGAGNDTLIGDGDANLLAGYDGADTLRGAGGNDTLEGLGTRVSWLGDSRAAIEAAIADEGDTIDAVGGADLINANEGDDVITARDGFGDTINCGPGNDTGERESVDTVNADCEGVALPVEMPPDDPIVPPADPPAPPPPVTPPPAPPPPVTPPAATPTVAQLLTLPSSRRCASRRRFRVRVRSTIRGTVRRVTIFINGKRVKTVTGSRIGLPIDLRGLPKGRIRVRLRVELKDGRVATDTRRYRTCATKRRRGQFG